MPAFFIRGANLRDCSSFARNNKWNGGYSESGARSRRWDWDILRVARRYPEALIEYLKLHPGNFVKIWEDDGITIYKVVNTEHTSSRLN